MRLEGVQTALARIDENRTLAIILGLGVLTVVRTANTQNPSALFGPFVSDKLFSSTYVRQVAEE